MNKKILLLTSLILSTVAISTEMSVEGKLGYDFNLLKRTEGIKFEPKMPVTLSIKFAPTDIDLRGEFNIENKEIDGLFHESSIADNFSIDGKVSYLSDKLYKGLKIGASLDLVASKGAKFSSGESGDIAIELGPHYDLGKMDLGALVYYKSNQVMEPKKAGLSLVASGYDTSVKLTGAYNLETLHKFKTVVAKPGTNLKKEYTDADKGTVYYYGENSKVKLIPIYVNFNLNNTLSVVDRLTINTNVDLNLDYTKFEGLLLSKEIKDKSLATIFNNSQNSEREQRDLALHALNKANKEENKPAATSEEEATTEAKGLQNYDNINLDFATTIGLKYDILDNLVVSATDKISVNYSELSYIDTSATEAKTVNEKSIKLRNTLDTLAKYTIEIPQVTGLSVDVFGGFGLDSEVNLAGEKDFSMESVATKNTKFSAKDSKSVHDMTVHINSGVNYQVFETLSVGGGLGIQVTGTLNNKVNAENEFLFRGFTPRIFATANYSW